MMLKKICLGLMVFIVACNGGGDKQKNLASKDSLNQTPDVADLIETGQSIFLQRCATCHAVNMTLTGPALKGVEKRWHNKGNLYDFIRNPQAVIEQDQYAKGLFYTYNKVQMPSFTDLKDQDIKAILTYIKNASISARH